MVLVGAVLVAGFGAWRGGSCESEKRDGGSGEKFEHVVPKRLGIAGSMMNAG
jgi:hypothetical protein